MSLRVSYVNDVQMTPPYVPAIANDLPDTSRYDDFNEEDLEVAEFDELAPLFVEF